MGGKILTAITSWYIYKPNLLIRGVTEQSTLAERGEFHENSTPILRVDYSCIYNNL